MNIRKKKALLLCVILMIGIFCIGCMIIDRNTGHESDFTYSSHGEHWNFGYGRRQILPDEDSAEPLYIAGYNNGVEITGVLDYCEARAVWLDTGAEGVLLIGIDCVAVDSSTVEKIRHALSDLENCVSVNVYATHTHAGIDTLGLWGPVGIDGKNEAYMKALVRAAEEAARDAYTDRHSAVLYFGEVLTQDMYRDSRYPEVCDEMLYQLRFSPQDGSAGLRLYFYGAHAESLRGSNTLLSRDFPGLLCDGVTEAVGDNTMFMPGAIGGLIMTKEFVSDTSLNAVENLQITSDKLVEYALSITPERERIVQPNMKISRNVFDVPMDNTAFLLYKFLGILQSKAVKADSGTGYGIETELCLLMLDDLTIGMIPGEIFPELVSGEKYGNANKDGVNPMSLTEIAAQYGIDKLLIIGLANDEIGYIVPPSDYLLNSKMPYLEKTMDYKGENHYEETNSVGPKAAEAIAEAFRVAAEACKR